MRRSAGPLRSVAPRLLVGLTGLFLIGPGPAALGPAGLGPAALGAQTLEERELDYRASLSAYVASVEARDVYRSRFYTLLDSLSAARAASDQDRVDALEGRVRDVSLQLASRDARVEEASAAYEAARDALLVALDQRLDSLEVVAEMSIDPLRRREAGILIRGLQVQYAEVAAEQLEETVDVRPVILPAITREPRDTPATLEAKAQLLESRAEDFQLEIDEVDQALERYRREVRLNQFTADTRSSIDRFGDRQVPVRGATGAERGEQGIVADTTGVDLESLPPQDAIVRLTLFREQLVLARDATLARARELRGGARGEGVLPEEAR